MIGKNKVRIVLLDDDAVIRTVLSASLRRRGFEVFAYETPMTCPLQSASECFCGENESCTDVILSDLDMPEIDGFTFIEAQKQKRCRCEHMAIMSGLFSSAEIARADALGCRIFEKPFQMNTLHNWLDGVRRQIDPSRVLRDCLHHAHQSV
jgi:CheY-like chemotaxis protein